MSDVTTLPCGHQVRGLTQCPVHDVPGGELELYGGDATEPSDDERYDLIMRMRALVPPMTYRAIGAALTPKISHERVRQIIARGRPALPVGRPPKE